MPQPQRSTSTALPPGVARPEGRARRWWRTAVAILVAVAAGAAGAAPGSTGQPLVLARIEGSGTQSVAGVLATAVFRRAGLAVVVRAYPASRASAMASKGRTDGEVGRVEAYYAQHPGLLRIDPPLMATEAAVYVLRGHPLLARGPVARAADLDGWRVGVVRGVIQSEQAVAGLPGVEVLNSARQMHRMLLAGRLDAVIDSPINQQRFGIDLGTGEGVVRAGSLGMKPIHIGLQRRHAALVPRVTAALAAMQADGSIERLRAEAERDHLAQRVH